MVKKFCKNCRFVKMTKISYWERSGFLNLWGKKVRVYDHTAYQCTNKRETATGKNGWMECYTDNKNNNCYYYEEGQGLTITRKEKFIRQDPVWGIG